MTTWLFDFLRGIYTDIENGIVIGVLFLDLKKTCVSVNHYILLLKLQSAGLTEFTVNWFASYLSNNFQLTKVNNAQSSKKWVEYGAPQGSIQGPLLFMIFINDLPNISNKCRIHL